ncbi:MAG: DNA translocase FtsK [Fimbriiglobus sp.]
MTDTLPSAPTSTPVAPESPASPPAAMLPPVPWRLDAVALGLFAAGVGVAGCVAARFTDTPNPTGFPGERVAAAVTDAVGVGAGVLATGWCVGIGLYVANRSRTRLAVRAAGWGVLTVAAATAADFLAPPAAVSPFGPGGSVGAWVRFALTDRLTPVLAGAAVVGAAFGGLVLAADGLVRFVGGNLAAAAVRGNAAVGVAGDRFLRFAFRHLARLRQRTPRVEPLVSVTTPNPAPIPVEPAGPPIIRCPAMLPVEPPPVPTPAPVSVKDATGSGAVPIRRPASLTDTPPPVRDLADIPVGPAGATTLSLAPAPTHLGYELPPLSLLSDPEAFPVNDHEQRLRERGTLLEKTFTDFGLAVKVVGIHTGPVITQYEIALETGLRLNKVTVLADDLALNLGVQSIRIVAPLPGRTTVGVEVPNDHRQTVRLKELMLGTTAKALKCKLPVFLGKDVEGRPLVYDMATMPHLLIAGRTGTGKSVCLNTIILSFLFSRTPEECRLLLIDPKKVEFSDYAHVPHLMHPVVTDDKKAEAILAWAVDKMEERYELLRRAKVRNIHSYNELSWEEIVRRVDPESEDERKNLPRRIPYVVIVVDEVGDLLMSMKKEVESHIIRLAQKSRAAGIHLILATQKPTVDVITGLIKSNLPARVCFQVASRADSAVVLDEKGAEKLLGMGDMLFLQPGTGSIVRGQGAYVDDQEIQRVTEALAVYEPNFESELLNLKSRDAAMTDGGAAGPLGEKLRNRDELYEQAIEIVVREQRGSTSLLQRALGIGYGRASRLVDFMAEDGILGGYNGSSAREVLLTPGDWESKRAA